MLQDFLANRPGASSQSTETQSASTGFQSLFAARAAGLASPRREIEPVVETKKLDAPEIELVEEAGQLRRIIVTCTCCEKITIDCEY